jgi:hypothetical protein
MSDRVPGMGTPLPSLSSGSNRSSNLNSFDPGFELPDLHQAQLDWDGVDCVLADLDDFAAIIEIQGRDATGKAVKVEDVVTARDLLVAGGFTAVQCTYRFADQVWSDTLIREKDGVRFLRMLDPARVSGSDTMPA